jgi:transcriptional regulator with XRE-family HTH domain
VDETQASGGHSRPGDEPELPERRVTVNMLVGHNMAYFRKAAGLTQEQLGELLGGWTKVAVSAAERSWDGKRVRKFDADEIADIAQALSVPIAALFLPPEDDMTQYRYLIGGSEQVEGATMRDLLTYAMSEPTEDDAPAMRAYEERLVSAVDKYLDSNVAEMLATRLKERAAEEQLAKALRDARRSRAALEYLEEALADLFSDNELLQKFLTTMLKATPEGQALVEQEERRERLERGEPTPEDDELTPERRRRVWENLPAAEREWQEKLALISGELFGERGPANRGELDQLIAEAHKRGIEGPNAARVLLRHNGTYELVRPYDIDEPEVQDS